MVTVPEALIEKLKNKQVVLFVGAGLSIGAGLPNWKGLLDHLYTYLGKYKPADNVNRQYIREALDEDDLLHAAELLYEEMGKGLFAKAITEIIRDEDAKPRITHNLIAELRHHFYCILTTNYDILLEAAFDSGDVPVYHQNQPTELQKVLETDRFCIVKCHGDIDQTDTIILTKESYDQLMRDNSAYRTFIQNTFTSKTVLFVGFSLSDPDLALFMSNVFSDFNGVTPTHYALMRRNDISQRKIQKFGRDHNIVVIDYDDHNEVESFLQQLVDAMPAQMTPEQDIVVDGSPFPGLRAFTEDNAHLYFGRKTKTTELLTLVINHPMVVVIGASGSGKSSLVGGGLIPAYRKLADGKQKLNIITMKPGENPFQSLALAQKLIDNPFDVITRLMTDGLQVLTDVLPENTTCLLFVDQFEEIFTLTNSEKQQAEFIAMLQQATDKIKVVVTMRADFFPQASAYLEAELTYAQLTVGQSSPVQLRQMIEEPAKLANITFDIGLVEKILDDTGSEPGNLALMAYLLDELYKADDDNRLTFAEYEALGGVKGAIGKRAEQQFEALDGTDDEKMGWLERVFSRLVTVREDGTATRKRAMYSDFEATDPVWVDKFVQERLLVTDTVNDDPIVDVAHEALLRSWKRLKDWIALRQADFYVEKRMEQNFTFWKERGRQETHLPTNEQITEFLDAIKNLKKTPQDLSKEFQFFIRGEDERGLESLAIEEFDRDSFQFLMFRMRKIGVHPIDVYETVLLNSNARVEVRRDAADALQQYGALRSQAVILQALQDETSTVREGALYALELLGSSEQIAEVLPLLQDENGSVRSTATYVVKEHGNSTHTPHILPLLQDENGNVRSSAVQTIEKLGTANDLPQVLPFLQDKNSDIRSTALQIVGKLGSADTLPQVLPFLKDNDSDVRQATVQVVGKLGSADTLPQVLPFLKDNDSDVRQATVQVVGKLGSAEHLPQILPLLNDNASDVRQATVQVVEKLGSAEHLPQILPLLNDNSSNVRASSVKVVGKHGNSEHVSQLIPMLKEPDPEVNFAAADALTQLARHEDLPKMLPLLQVTQWGAPYGAVKVIAKHGSAEYLPQILPLLKHHDYDVREVTVKFVQQVGNTEHLPQILSMLKDSNSDSIRQAAINTVAKLGGAAYLPQILPLLQDKNATIHQAAIQLIEKSGNIEHLPLVLPRLHDESESVRQAAIQFVGRFGNTGHLPNALPLLDDESEIVRQAATNVVAQLGSSAHAQLLMPLLQDRNIEVRLAAFLAIHQLVPDAKDFDVDYRNLSTVRHIIKHIDGFEQHGEEIKWDDEDKIALGKSALRMINHPVAQEAVARWDAEAASEDDS